MVREILKVYKVKRWIVDKYILNKNGVDYVNYKDLLGEDDDVSRVHTQVSQSSSILEKFIVRKEQHQTSQQTRSLSKESLQQRSRTEHSRGSSYESKTSKPMIVEFQSPNDLNYLSQYKSSKSKDQALRDLKSR